MKEKIEALFERIAGTDLQEYTSLLFNIYEDRDYFTMEASFDDEAYLIGREKPFIVADKSTPWETVESIVGKMIEAEVKAHKEAYAHFESISYGFVDGDLYYIREPEKKKKEAVHFTADDFKNFPSHKLTAWLAVYLTKEAKQEYKPKMMDLMFRELSEEEHKYWREILSENFDYSKYEG